MPIIEVEDVTKEFRLGQTDSMRTSVLNGLRRLVRRPVEERPLFKALDRVSFNVEEGEVVGIIGHNGAGKSTLLKMLAGISKPSSGRVTVGGRIAPLIEVGAGFVPEMTGRENIYLNGSILGMSRREIDRRFDEIVAFAEMEAFIDTPVKRYSSGMKVKLAFSVATSVDAEILLVDEVLAVGDLAFQRKCFDRMEWLIRRDNRTVLVVSHNIRQISRICHRSVMLECGRIVADSDPLSVSDYYYRRSNMEIHKETVGFVASCARIQSTGEATLTDVTVLDDHGNQVDAVESGASITIRVKFNLTTPLESPELVVGTHTTDFVYLDSGSTASVNRSHFLEPGEHCIDYHLDSYPLVAGEYCVRFALLDRYRRMILSGESIRLFSVNSRCNQALEASARLLSLPCTWVLDGVICRGVESGCAEDGYRSRSDVHA